MVITIVAKVIRLLGFFDVGVCTSVSKGVLTLITRLSADTACLDDQGFEQLAKALDKRRQRLFTVTGSRSRAEQTAAALNVRGYVAEVQDAEGAYRVVYTGDAPRVRLADAASLGLIPCQDGLYRAFTREAGVYDYDFDDGAVWKVQSFDDGEYLVKVVEDDDEERVVRQASTKLPSCVTGENYPSALRLLYGEVSRQLLNDVEHDAPLRSALVAMLNRRVRAKVVDVLRMHRLDDRALTPELMDVVARAQATSSQQLIKAVTAHLLAKGRGTVDGGGQQ